MWVTNAKSGIENLQLITIFIWVNACWALICAFYLLQDSITSAKLFVLIDLYNRIFNLERICSRILLILGLFEYISLLPFIIFKVFYQHYSVLYLIDMKNIYIKKKKTLLKKKGQMGQKWKIRNFCSKKNTTDLFKML